MTTPRIAALPHHRAVPVVTNVWPAQYRPLRILRASLVPAVLLMFIQVSSALAAAVAPPLGTAGTYGVLGLNSSPTVGTVTCTDTGPGTFVTADVGTTFTSITNTGCLITGAIDAPVAPSVVTDFNNAYNALENLNPTCDGTIPTTSTILPPGVYCSTAGTTIGAGVIFTLNGNASDVWVFKVGTSGNGALTGNSFQVVMGGSALACNVYWRTAEAATMTDSIFIGTVLAGTAVTMTRGSWEGRALARTNATITNAAPFTFAGCSPPSSITVRKNFVPNDPATVPVALTCTSGTVVGTTPLNASEGSPAVFTVGGADLAGTTCTATETVPQNYTADQTNCVGVALDGSCTIVNTLSCVPPPSGMETWHPGNGDPNDIQGPTFEHGTLMNGAAFSAGLVNQAFSFDGINDFVEVADAPNIRFGGTAPMSVDMWVNRTSANNVQHFIGKRMTCNGDANGTFQMFLAPNCGLGFGQPDVPTICSGIDLPMNTWTHLAATFDGTTQSLYKDAQLIGQLTASLGPANNAPLLIGATSLSCNSRPQGGETTGGLVDEVEIFSRALSQAEIASIFNAGSAGKCLLPEGADIFTVIKDFSDNNTATVSVGLSCTPGVVTASPLNAAEGAPAMFTVTGVEAGTTCTATETVPPGYTADQTDCVDVNLADPGSCTITNTAARATFTISKVWTESGDTGSIPVSAHLSCTGVTPAEQDVVFSANTAGVLIVENIDLAVDGVDCTITETVPANHIADYEVSEINPDNCAAFDCFDSDPPDNFDGCFFADVNANGANVCVITNTPEPASITVFKDWTVAGGDQGFDGDYKIALQCEDGNNIGLGGSSPAGFVESTLFGCNGSSSNCIVSSSFDQGDGWVEFTLANPGFGAQCVVLESFDDSVIDSSNDCEESFDVGAGADIECHISNTVFFEGIPTLSQYSLAILALLMLGVGFVGFRRFV